MARKPYYETEPGVQGDAITDRKNISLPAEIYDNFIILASDLDFGHKGKVAVVPLLDAISQIDPEKLYDVLKDCNLLPRQQYE